MSDIFQVLEPLSNDEYAALKASIAEFGILQPIIVDENNIVIDGHHRRRAAAELGIKDKDIPKIMLAGLTAKEKRIEARRLNSARRQISQSQRRQLIRDTLLDAPERSDRQIAVALGVSPTTIGAMRKGMEAAEELSKLDSRVGADGKERKKPVVIHNPTDRQKRLLKNSVVVEKMQSDGLTSPVYSQRILNKEAKAKRKNVSVTLTGDEVKLICDDIRGGLPEIPDASINVIITDAPYEKSYIPLYENLSLVAGRVLVDGGSLLCMTGQSHLPDVMRLLCTNDKLCYHWTLSYITPRAAPSLPWMRLSPHYKPIVWLVKGKYCGDWVSDIIYAPPDNGTDKEYHPHGQSVAGMCELISRFSNPGDTIADFFTGAGSVGVAAVKANRRFIGSDISHEYITIAKERIAAALNSK